jgi:hypothetical protein
MEPPFYSVREALCFGVAKQHFRIAIDSKQQTITRIEHGFLGIILSTPGISQAASLGIVARQRFKKHKRTHTDKKIVDLHLEHLEQAYDSCPEKSNSPSSETLSPPADDTSQSDLAENEAESKFESEEELPGPPPSPHLHPTQPFTVHLAPKKMRSKRSLAKNDTISRAGISSEELKVAISYENNSKILNTHLESAYQLDDSDFFYFMLTQHATFSTVFPNMSEAAFFFKCVKEHKKSMIVFCLKFVEINSKDNDGNTALHVLCSELAIDLKIFNCIMLLLDNKADPSILNHDNHSAYSICQSKFSTSNPSTQRWLQSILNNMQTKNALQVKG